jgi:hypothetical protein
MVGNTNTHSKAPHAGAWTVVVSLAKIWSILPPSTSQWEFIPPFLTVSQLTSQQDTSSAAAAA